MPVAEYSRYHESTRPQQGRIIFPCVGYHIFPSTQNCSTNVKAKINLPLLNKIKSCLLTVLSWRFPLGKWQTSATETWLVHNLTIHELNRSRTTSLLSKFSRKKADNYLMFFILLCLLLIVIKARVRNFSASSLKLAHPREWSCDQGEGPLFRQIRPNRADPADPRFLSFKFVCAGRMALWIWMKSKGFIRESNLTFSVVFGIPEEYRTW